VKTWLLAMGAIWLVAASPLGAQGPEPLIEEAVKEYQQALNTGERESRLEHFRRAERLFAKVMEEQGIKNADLLANLGNAALQSGQTGQAILAYRRALVLDPRHPRALGNLRHARGLLPDWVPRPKGQSLLDTFFFWHRSLSRSARSLAASMAFAMASMLLAAFVCWRWAWCRNMVLLAGLVWLGLVGVPLWTPDHGNDAVVAAGETEARAADSAGAPARFAEPLPGGTEVRIVETRGNWANISLADGRTGWVRSSSVTRIEPGGRGA